MTRKQAWNIIVLGAIGTASIAPQIAATDDLSLNVSAGSETVLPGATVTVTLDVTGLSAPINGVQVFLAYDPTLLTLTGVSPNTSIGAGWTEGVESDVGGAVDFVAAMNGGSTQADHTIATLSFTADALGTTNIAFRTVAAPIFTRLTRVDNSVILPSVFDSGGIVIHGPPPHVASIDVFYSGKFADATDPSIWCLAAGATATIDNIGYYIRGITGIRITFDELVDFQTLDPRDAFSFEWTAVNGTTFTPVTNATTTISVTSAAVGGVTVATVVINDDHVMKRWLKTTIDATQVSTAGVFLDGELTGNPILMPSGDTAPGGNAVFFLANMAGDSDGTGVTDLNDVSVVRVNSNQFIGVPIDDVFDVDKSGVVNLNDVSVTRAAANQFEGVPLFTPIP